MASNLEFINQTKITPGVTTINVDNVFSDKYDTYYCNIVGFFHDTDVSNGVEGLRFIGSSGNVISSSDYDYGAHTLISTGSFSETQNTGDTRIWIGTISDQLTDGQANASFYIFNPYDSTSYTFVASQASGGNSSETLRGSKGIGVHKSAEAIRGFQFYESNGARTFGGGTINVYGVK
jgi:hypothetical protein|tara:strand:+ start:57 stop:590 length:534 start_codon:yes stop_codon:yes gene_type:complete